MIDMQRKMVVIRNMDKERSTKREGEEMERLGGTDSRRELGSR